MYLTDMTLARSRIAVTRELEIMPSWPWRGLQEGGNATPVAAHGHPSSRIAAFNDASSKFCMDISCIGRFDEEFGGQAFQQRLPALWVKQNWRFNLTIQPQFC